MKILIADDHPLYREALRAQIERLFPESVVIEASSFDEIAHFATDAADPFKLFLLDYHMPGMSGDALRQLAARFPAVPIAVVSGTADAADVRTVIQAGAHGFIPKTATGVHLLHALQVLLAGGTSVPVSFAFPENPADENAKPETAPWLATLTSRELEVLKRLTRGLSNKQIGRELELAEVTVKLHLRSIFRKIGVHTRAEAAVIATKANIV